jgi:hypothetical protein
MSAAATMPTASRERSARLSASVTYEALTGHPAENTVI